MQLTQDTTKILSNVKTESHTFGIKQENMSFLMGILTKMYANPIQTLTQEYISNARDANREVRQSRKIEITAPTRFNPNMLIRDFGPGLSPDRILNVFLYYGSSTKRDTNTQLGGFGIGGKSAWAYTDSFTITTWHDGYKRSYIAHKSNGNGNLDMISEETSSAPNGTQIEIAVNPMDVSRFKNAILRTVFFWKDSERPVLKGFEANELPLLDIKPDVETFKEIKIYKQLPSFVTQESKIAVIDGIPYPIRIDMSKLSRLIRQNFAVILNTGDVHIAPNREEFVDDKVSQAFFKQIDETLTVKITDHINSELKRVPNLKDGLKQFVLLYSRFEFKGKYKNYNLDSYGLWIDDPVKSGHYNSRKVIGNTWEFYRTKFRKAEMNFISTNQIEHVFYDDMPNEHATKKVWRVKKMLQANKTGGRYFCLLNHDEATFAQDVGATNLSSIDATDYTVQRQAKAAVKKLETCLHYFDRGLTPTQVAISAIPHATIVYASLNNTDGLYDKRNNTSETKTIGYINSKPGMRFAFIADSQLDKIKGNKTFIHYDEFIKTNKATDDELKYWCKRECDSDYRYMQYLKPVKDNLKDPVLKYLIELSLYAPGHKVSSYMPECFIDKDNPIVKQHYDYIKVAKTFDTRYPMLYRLLDNGALEKKAAFKQDVISYLNRKFKESSKPVSSKGANP